MTRCLNLDDAEEVCKHRSRRSGYLVGHLRICVTTEQEVSNSGRVKSYWVTYSVTKFCFKIKPMRGRYQKHRNREVTDPSDQKHDKQAFCTFCP